MRMPLFVKQQARRRALRHAADGPLHTYLSVPFPAARTRCCDLGIMALDLETTGLDPASDSILSIGMVTIDNMAVRLDTAWHQLVRIYHAIPEASAVIHGITDDQAVGGLPLEQVLPELLTRLAGKVILVHHAAIEQRFLDQACHTLYGSGFLAPLIDTEVLARRQLERRHQPFRPLDLRLFNLRTRYGLPRYPAHNALSDALGTAELFLAISAGLHPGQQCRLKDVLA
jgi:DNA polymerase-3 subunit epsilon